MAIRIAQYPWAATPLGAIERWSAELRIALDLCLGSRMCGCIYWGPERLILYNDAYSSILGTKHPWALGRSADEVWPEIIEVIGPLMRQTLLTGATTGGDDAPIFLNRSGYVEEFYCSFSYAPIVNAVGTIEGVFATLPETSGRVIGERRLRILQRLGADARGARTPRQTLEIAAQVLGSNPCDVPFAAFYTWHEGDAGAELGATVNISAGSPLCPRTIQFGDPSPLSGCLDSALETGFAVLALDASSTDTPLGAWKVPARELLLAPIPPFGENAPRALMLTGVNPHKRLDDDHREFFRMMVEQLRRSLSEAFSHELEEVRSRELQQLARAAQQTERVRIARDLHDTLLQSMQGLRFLLEAGIERHKAGQDALKLFEDALRASVCAVDEGRAVLSLLRSTSAAVHDLPASLSALGDKLVADTGISFSTVVSGSPRELTAVVWNDIYGIGREAVANAVRHSKADHIELTLEYGSDLRLQIRDDGRGADWRFLTAGRPGHFGIQGMRERAKNVGGQLEIHHSRAGTTLAVIVPGEAAYAG